MIETIDTGNAFITFGYYICEISAPPAFLKGLSNSFISISECLCNHEPQLNRCHGWKPRGDDEEYISRFSGPEEYLKLSEEATKLFDQNLLYPDGRFIHLEDAHRFFRTYFDDRKHLLVAVSTLQKYLDLMDDSFIYDKEMMSQDPIVLGKDIVGWDIAGFHSFLCNLLHEEFPEIAFNSQGLIDESFEYVEMMASAIQGKGEPVDWIPVLLSKIG